MSQRQFGGDIIELRALDPDGDLACDISVATEKAREGLPEALRLHLLPPVRTTATGVEVTFAPEAWDAVQRYVALESQCCSFLTLRAERKRDVVVLSVMGRADARSWIDQIFA
jgi:hypothetical protein